MFNYGTVVIQTGAGAGEIAVFYASKPVELRNMITQQADTFRATQVREQARIMADEMRQRNPKRRSGEAQVRSKCARVQVVLAALILAACGGGSGSSDVGSDEQAVTRLIRHNVELINKRDWRGLYQGLSPRTRELCTYDRFRDGMQAASLLMLGPDGQLGVVNVKVTVEGEVASASYDFQAANQNASERGDVFVKVKGNWYDVDEDGIICPKSDEPPLSQPRARPAASATRGVTATVAPTVVLATVTPSPTPPAALAERGTLALVSDNILNNAEIYTVNADGSALTNLTAHRANDWDPAWSPNGSRIAFVSDRDGNPEIYVMDRDGKNVTRVTNNTVDDLNPAWFPDGSHIAFARPIETQTQFGSRVLQRIHIMDASGQDQRPLRFDALKLNIDSDNHREPAVSPDGLQIAFQVDRGDHPPLPYLMTLGAGDSVVVRRIGASSGIPPLFRNLAWSPDGSALVAVVSYYGYDTTGRDYREPAQEWLTIVTLDPYKATRLSSQGGKPSWSSDGRTIAFSKAGVLCAVDVKSGTERCLTQITAAYNPVWAPQPARLTSSCGTTSSFTSPRGGPWRLTQSFASYLDTFGGQIYGGYHSGEDWAYNGSPGNAPVLALGPGQIVKISALGNLGSLVAVEHSGAFTIPARSEPAKGETYSYAAEVVSRLFAVYLHIDPMSNLQVGDCVKSGQQIGTLASIDTPHLHIEIRATRESASRDWSLVGSSDNWAVFPGTTTHNGYYVHVQPMIDAGVRHPAAILEANAD